MDFIKKNYEKVVLGLVLFGLVVAAVLMLFLVAGEKQQLEELRNTFINYRVIELPPQELARTETLLKRASTPTVVNLSDSMHRLFNPVTWVRTPDQRVVKIDVDNLSQKLEVTKITKLYTVVSLENVAAFESGTRYTIGIEQQAASRAPQRSRRPFPASINEKKDFFIIRGVEGPGDNPTNVVLELTDTGERVGIAKERPFRRVDGYMADLKYPPTGQTFVSRRKDDNITIAGETYKIVSITAESVVLSAPNGRKWTVPFKAPTQ